MRADSSRGRGQAGKQFCRQTNRVQQANKQSSAGKQTEFSRQANRVQQANKQSSAGKQTEFNRQANRNSFAGRHET